MALPREPRQKMINMMYLVLTALLALNVSSEILNAFKTVNKSLEKTNSVISASTDNVMTSLKEKLADPGTRAKAEIWYPKADDVQKKSVEVYNYIQGLKDRILTEAGGDVKDSTKRYKEDNLDIATRIMIEKGEGPKLLKMLSDYKNFVLSKDPLITKEFANSLPINLTRPTSSTSRAGKTWEGAYFHMVPTVAALTILSKFQNDLKVTENKIITFCHEQVGKVVYRQDAVAALALANSTNLLPGQDLEITAGVGGFSKAVNPIISIGGRTIALSEDGAAHLKMSADAIGLHSVPVVIRYTDQDGKVQTIEKKVEYSVGQSNAAVQLDKLNVLFIGIENPITISGSGSVDQLQVYASGPGGAVISGSGGHRSVRVNSETNDCVINIKTPDGKVTPVKFRVRSIPDPTPMIGINKGGEIQASYFKSQAGVRAVLENFFYETQFNVTSFRITGDGEGFENIEEKNNTGATWNEARSIINKCRAGSFITIEDIRCVGPDGRNRKLPPMLFNLR